MSSHPLSSTGESANHRSLARDSCVFLAVVATAPHPAFAWGDEGHKIIALIAEHYLDPAARAKMAMLLSADTDTLTGHDIASEATWAATATRPRSGVKEHGCHDSANGQTARPRLRMKELGYRGMRNDNSARLSVNVS
jgi:hypothetical protein